MSMTDPVADMLTRIRNGQSAGKNLLNSLRLNLKYRLQKYLKKKVILRILAPKQLALTQR